MKNFLGISEDTAFAISVIVTILSLASIIYAISVNRKREKLIQKIDDSLDNLEAFKGLAKV